MGWARDNQPVMAAIVVGTAGVTFATVSWAMKRSKKRAAAEKAAVAAIKQGSVPPPPPPPPTPLEKLVEAVVKASPKKEAAPVDRWKGEHDTSAMAGSCAAMVNSLNEMAEEFRPGWYEFWASVGPKEQQAINALAGVRRTLVGRCAGGAQPDPGISQFVREVLVYKGQGNPQSVINVIKANQGLLGFGLGNYLMCGSACR